MYQAENRISGGEDKVEELDYTKKGYIFLKKIKERRIQEMWDSMQRANA